MPRTTALWKHLFCNFLLLALFLPVFSPVNSQTARHRIAPTDKAVLDRISADSLRGHLSFIASDLLEGRDTPSRGLELAAEYIAAQFRRSKLEPAGDDGYFQTARWIQMMPAPQGFSLTINHDNRTTSISQPQISLPLDQGLTITNAAIFRLDYQAQATWSELTEEQLAGRIVLTEIPVASRDDRVRFMEAMRWQSAFIGKMRALKAALVISIERSGRSGTGAGTRRLIDPEARTAARAPQLPAIMTLHDPQTAKLYDDLKNGETTATLALTAPPALEKPVQLRNVVGLLRGSDPKLKDTYVLVTAHYDHIGMRADGAGDRIFNGANDDGSGTVSVIELAAALSARRVRPKRSIVFMTVFGEEKGLLGSRYYGRHPIFPLSKTVADINLEQVGRTDSSEGPQVNTATLTGFDFTDLGATFKAAGKLTGINVYQHERNSDAFFSRSDNQALADAGVPAHTLCTAFEYPDYHGLGDHWDKIDYDNFARVNRLIALALLRIADNPTAPKWNEANPKTAKYVQAWQKLQAK